MVTQEDLKHDFGTGRNYCPECDMWFYHSQEDHMTEYHNQGPGAYGRSR